MSVYQAPDHPELLGGQAPLEQQLKKNDTIGDCLSLPKDPSLTRFYVQNPRGFTLGHSGSLAATLEHIKSMEVDHAMFPEHTLDTTQYRVRAGIHRQATRHFGFGEYKVVTGSSTVQAHTYYKPGGTMSLTVGQLKGRVIDSGADDLGRWTYQKLTAQGGNVITVVCTYQVNKEKPQDAGPRTAITQQYSMLKQAGRQDPHKIREHHAKDLLAFVKLCQSRGEKIIVGGDFNETIGHDANGLTRLCTECDLQDIIFDRHGVTDFATHETGSKVIDFLLVQSDLALAVKHCGYEPFKIHIDSDHRGVYIDVYTDQFFGSDTVPLAKLEHRDIISKKTHQIPTYFKALAQQFEDHKWFQGIQQLRDCMDRNEPNHSLAEALDTRRIRSCIHAGKQVKRYPTTPYSPEIARLRTIDHILKLAIHQFTSQYDHSETMEGRQAQLGSIGITIPDNVQECRKLRQENLKVLVATEKEEFKKAKLWSEHLDSLANQYDAEGKSDEAKCLR